MRLPWVLVLMLASSWVCPSFAAEPSQWLAILQKVRSGDQDLKQASEAAKSLQSGKPAQITAVLQAMRGATPLGRNWLSAVASHLYLQSRDGMKRELESFLADSTQDSEARYLVFTWLTDGKSELKEQMLNGMLEDPSPELRFAAIDQQLQKKKGSKEVADHQSLLAVARHPSQVIEILQRLKDLGKEIPQADHFGFLFRWQVIAPFDNVGQKAFDKVYPVETDLLQNKFDASAKYDGKSGMVQWKPAEAEAKEGQVDLNPIFEKEKGAIAYARCEFTHASELPVDIRVGCINAHKVWLNGDLILSNEVYHASMQIDQYIGQGKLKAGKNVIVVKVCQNEQTEDWAQRWTYQLRLCDSTGKAVRVQQAN